VRGDDEQSGHLFSYLSPEQRVPADHPLRAIRTMTDDALRRLSPRFETLYATTGRPSIPPEHLLRALLLHVLYSVRSERMLTEQLQCNLLFRHVRLRRDVARAGGDTANRAEEEQPQPRRPHNPASGLCDQPRGAQAN
jgi:hypothetical protein